MAPLKWNFNLDKIPTKDNLKDPLGYKANITDVTVRSTGKRT